MPCRKQFNGWVILRFLVCNNNSNKYAPIWEINTETSEVYKLIKKNPTILEDFHLETTNQR